MKHHNLHLPFIMMMKQSMEDLWKRIKSHFQFKDYFGIDQISHMFWREKSFWRSITMDYLWGNGDTFKKELLFTQLEGWCQKSMSKLVWHSNKIEQFLGSKRDCCKLLLFQIGLGRVCPWTSWWASHFERDLIHDNGCSE